MSSITFSTEELRKEHDLLRQFDGKTVLICGGGGLIGSSVLEYLMQANEKLGMAISVIAHDWNMEKLRERFREYEGRKELSLIAADVATFSEADLGGMRPDYIIHAASPSHPVAYATQPVEVLKANFSGAANLLEIATRLNARLLYISSAEVYGQTDCADERGNAESDYGFIDLQLPRACYPEGKRSAEALCVSYHTEYQTDAVIARPCQVYGPGITADNSRADAQFIRKCRAGEDIVMKSPGSQVRSICYVKDAVTALLYILSRGESGVAYNIANPHSIATIREFAQTLADIAGVKVVDDFLEDTATEARGYTKIVRSVLNSEKLQQLGWKPQYSLPEGLRETLNCSC